MKILYDHQAFTASRFGGVARYFYNLMVALQKKGIDVVLSVWFSNNHYLLSGSEFPTQPFRFFLGPMRTNMLFSQVNRLCSTIQLLRKNYDIFHPTFFHPYFLNFIGNKPFVMTYHDAIKDKFGERFGHLDNASKEQKKVLFDRATHIIAVSENTKNDLIQIFQLDPAKITVVYHATNFRDLVVPDTFQLDTPPSYLLYVGTRGSYKNFAPFLKAITPVLKKHTHIQFICGGGGDFNADEKQLIDSLGLSGRVIHYFINDLVLYRLYQHALAFVYPSLYEGFGIPILEAFATGCPVVLSNSSCFPEVAQDAALYFDPESEASMSEQIERIILDEPLRQSLRQKGFLRQQAFSPENMVNQTLNVYRRVVAQVS
ncbi:glycosyltransferase family 1 protein [Spirosoma sp. KNUC1025]|uniref:glycosyltransferase family 4 protein n=1 Tax=Spirosoma sp. KNUC1025 TaxID=2894082 RepID=UPI00386672F8|nr:glycosyltransferase family 4 protein [Spirosoma sp. KNUC1025]